jgi:copper homeostasis protein
VRAANGRLTVMAGGGVRAENVREIADSSGALEFHSSLRRSVRSPIKHQRRKIHLGNSGVDDYSRSVVRASDVQTLRKALNAAAIADVNGQPASTGAGRGTTR